jgi:hypothetical protein
MSKTLLALAALALLAGCDLWRPPADDGKAGEVPDAAVATGPLDLASLEGRIVARGAEPDWRLDADPQLGVVLSLDDLGLTYSTDYVAPVATAAGGARVQSGEITLTLEARSCRIGAKQYPMTASIEAGAETVRAGCAFVRWDRRLAEFLPAIDACLAKLPEKLPVTYAAQEPEGRVLVRMGRRYDCRAPVDPGAGPAIMTDADEQLQPGGDGDALFVRAPGVNPGGQCYEAPEVRAADGALLGWLDDPQGC